MADILTPTEALQQLRRLYEGIRDERHTYANTATRIGNAFLALLSFFEGAPFLRKDMDDTTSHKLGMGSADVKGNAFVGGNLTVGTAKSSTGASFGITKEGVATLARMVVDEIKSSRFQAGTMQGLDGSGFGLTKDSNSRYTLELDNLIVRAKMIIAHLEVHEISFIGDSVVLSPCGNRVSIVQRYNKDGGIIADNDTTTEVSYYRCYFLATDGEQSVANKWTVGQLARCKTNNLTSNTSYTDYSNHDYWRLCVGVDSAPVTIAGKQYHYIDLSNSTSESIMLTDASGTTHIVTIGGVSKTYNSIPQANDRIVGLGHQWDSKRQNVAILSSTDIGWTLYKGIESYDLPEERIVSKFSVEETILTTDHYTLRPYAEPTDTSMALCDRGVYADDKWYGRGDLVSCDGQMWRCSVPLGDTVHGERPSAGSAKWTLYVSKGLTLAVMYMRLGDVLADEGSGFTLSERSLVGYGAGDGWVFKTLDAGSYTAQTSLFYGTDPQHGTLKQARLVTWSESESDGDEWRAEKIGGTAGVVSGASDWTIRRIERAQGTWIRYSDGFGFSAIDGASEGSAAAADSWYKRAIAGANLSDSAKMWAAGDGAWSAVKQDGVDVTLNVHRTPNGYRGVQFRISGGNASTRETTLEYNGFGRVSAGRMYLLHVFANHSAFTGSDTVTFSASFYRPNGTKAGTKELGYDSMASSGYGLNPNGEFWFVFDPSETVDAAGLQVRLVVKMTAAVNTTICPAGLWDVTEIGNPMGTTRTNFMGVANGRWGAAPVTFFDYDWKNVKGSQGEQGNQGEQGIQGESGLGIAGITDFYKINNSATAPSVPSDGGRNLITKSDIDTYGTGNWGSNGGTLTVEGTADDGAKTLKVVGNDGILYNQFIRLQRNTTYTYSWLMKSSVDITIGRSTPLHMQISKTMTPAHLEIFVASSGTLKANTWQRVYVVVKTPNDQDVYYVRPFIYGIGGATVYICKPMFELGSTATDWCQAPEDLGWSRTSIAPTSAYPNLWHYLLTEYTDDTSQYTPPSISGYYGQASFKSIMFKRVPSGESVTKPADTEGSFASPSPTASGWSDGVPSGDNPLWQTTRIFTSDGKAPQQSSWTTPQKVSSTSKTQIRWSSSATNDGDPTSSNWSDNASTDAIWMAVRTFNDGVWSDWNISKIKGEKGVAAIGYRLVKMGDTWATVKVSGSDGDAVFRLSYNLHYKAEKIVGKDSDNAAIAAISANIEGEEETKSAPDTETLEISLSGEGDKPYTAEDRPASSIAVTVTLVDGTVLYDSVPVTMDAGVAIDINQRLGTMDVTIKGQQDAIASIRSDGAKISAKVQSLAVPNLLLNSGFAMVTNGMPDYWELWDDNKKNPTVGTQNTDECVVTVTTAGNFQGISQTRKMVLHSPLTLTFSCWAKGSGTFTVLLHKRQGTTTKQEVYTQQLGSDYTKQVVAHFTIDSLVDSWKLMLGFRTPVDGDNVTLRNPKLEMGETATSYCENGNDRVLATGMDIETGLVEFTADKFKIKDNSGNNMLSVEKKGNSSRVRMRNLMMSGLSLREHVELASWADVMKYFTFDEDTDAVGTAISSTLQFSTCLNTFTLNSGCLDGHPFNVILPSAKYLNTSFGASASEVQDEQARLQEALQYVGNKIIIRNKSGISISVYGRQDVSHMQVRTIVSTLTEKSTSSSSAKSAGVVTKAPPTSQISTTTDDGTTYTRDTGSWDNTKDGYSQWVLNTSDGNYYLDKELYWTDDEQWEVPNGYMVIMECVAGTSVPILGMDAKYYTADPIEGECVFWKVSIGKIM